MRKVLTLALCFITAGCAAPDAHAPPFARQPYEKFSRNDAVAIALDEWRLFGMRIDDNDGAGYVQTDTAMAERQPGAWQRIGEYWWEGLNANDPDNAWTGKHDAHGELFPAAVNGHYAWSAAFISYVMRIAGAGRDFPYAADHAFYINYAARAAKGDVRDPLLIAENPLNYAPRLGDLVCSGRGKARALRYDDLPTTQNFPAHCAIVTAGAADQISIIGGNVEDAVALTHVPTNNAGMVGLPWFVVLRVMYRR